MNRKTGPKEFKTGLIRASAGKPLFNFCDLSDEGFEECCCHILFHEPETRNTDLYGRPRQRQYGADATAERRDGTGIDVVSSKRYSSLRKGQIEKFGDEFLENWTSHWSTKRVRRFVLCVAADLRSRERQIEIEGEKRRFAQYGIEFEAWGPRQLSHRLHQHSEVIRAFFPDYYRATFSESISPALAETSAHVSSLLSSAVTSQIQGLQSVIAQDVCVTLDGLQAQLRTGKRISAERSLIELRNDTVRWNSVEPPLQARTLRMLALVALMKSEHTNCAALLDEAEAISQTKDSRIRALLALETLGIDEALLALAPTNTKEESLLRAALLIEANKVNEAKEILANWNSLQGNDPEWHRLIAYIACIERRTSDSLADIKLAEQLAPDWVAVIEAGAIVRYSAALSPVIPFRSFWLPEPHPVAFVQKDDESRHNIEAALQRFDALAKQELDSERRTRFDIWRFACLAQLDDREQDAEAACSSLLRRNPPPPVVVFWALGRGYDFDAKDTIRRIEAQLRNPNSSLDDLQAAVACSLAHGDSKKASAVLRRHASRFNNDQVGRSVTERLSARISAARRTSDSKPVAATGPLERLIAAIEAAKISKDWNPVDTLVAPSTEDPEMLWIVSNALSAAGRWDLAFKHSCRLLELAKTADALRLAVVAAYNARRYREAIGLLSGGTDLFPGARLPIDLQRLKTYAMAKRGDLHTALPLAIDLATSNLDTNDKMLLVDLLIRAGDLIGAASQIRETLPLRDWSADELLRWAPSISNEAPELAVTLVRMAMKVDPNRARAATIVGLNFRLGLDEEAHELLGKAHTFPSNATVRTASLAEIIEHLQANHDTVVEMTRLYRCGAAPIHMVSGPASINLAEIWNTCFSDRIGEQPLFIRSGNRAADFFPEKPQGVVHLHLDITAVLTIHQLEILALLDASDLTITLPNSLMSVLQALESDARPMQPSRIPILEIATEGGEIQAWESDTGDSPNVARIFYDSSDSSPAVKREGEAHATLGEVLEELIRRGGISEHQATQTRFKNEFWCTASCNLSLRCIDTLIFEENTLDVVISSGLLTPLKAHFSVWTNPNHQAACKAELLRIRQGNSVAENLRRLRHELSEGILSGRYGVLPEPSAHQLRQAKRAGNGACLLPMYELLDLPTLENGWLWIDDRYVTSHTACNGNFIVSTYEVLDHLRRLGKLTEARHHDLLQRMRSANVQVLPIRETEVFHAIRASTVNRESESLVETPSLSSIRRSFNRLLVMEPELDLEPLQRPRGRPLPEIGCLITAFGLCRRCLESVWTDPDFPDATREAASNWLWDSLKVKQYLRLPIQASQEDRRRVCRMATLLDVLMVLSIPWNRPAEPHSLRSRYLSWLETKMVSLTDKSDPKALDDLATDVAQSVLHLLQDSEGTPHNIPRETLRAYIGMFIDGLPEPLRNRVYGNARLAEVLQPDVRTVLSIGDATFDAADFWNSAARSKHSPDQTVLSMKGGTFTITALGGNIEVCGDNLKARISDQDFALLSEKFDERLSYLLGCFWLDESRGRHAAEAARIAAMEPASLRMQAIRDWRENFPPTLYGALGAALSSGESFSLKLLRAGTPLAYVKYLGLPITGDSIDWDSSAQSLIGRFDVLELLERWSGLPIPLPQAVQEAFCSLDADKQMEFLRGQTCTQSTPLRFLRALELSRICGRGGSTELLQSCISNWADSARTFLTVLIWSERQWKRDPVWHELPVPARLALVWAHADHILKVFMSSNCSQEIIQERFSQFHQLNARDLLALDLAYDSDVSSPSHVTEQILLVTALSSACANQPPAGWESVRLTLTNALTRRSDSGDAWPLAQLFEDRRYGANSLCSFLSITAHQWIADLFNRPEIQPLTLSGMENFLQLIVSDLESNPDSGQLWGIVSVIGIRWMSQPSIEKISRVAMKVQFPSSSLDENARLILNALSSLSPYLPEESRVYLRRELIKWVTRLAKRHKAPVVTIGSHSPASMDAESALNFALSLCRRNRLSETYRELGDLAKELRWKWPAIAQPMRHFLARVVGDSSCGELEEIWYSYLILRAAP